MCGMLLAFWPGALPAQTVAEHVARGDSLHAALEPRPALEHYRAAVALDSTAVEALWKCARSAIDVAKQLGTAERGRRDSLYQVARDYAERVTRLDSTEAEGYFMLAQALGRLSRTRGGRERVEFGREIYAAAATTLDLDSTHDGAHHVLGAWHAEVMRLGGLMRFFAENLLGGDYMDRASWDSSVAHLKRSVRLRPEYLFHRLELARVYVDLERYEDARAQLDTMLALAPTSDAMDPRYQEQAQRLLDEIAGRDARRQPPAPLRRVGPSTGAAPSAADFGTAVPHHPESHPSVFAHRPGSLEASSGAVVWSPHPAPVRLGAPPRPL